MSAIKEHHHDEIEKENQPKDGLVFFHGLVEQKIDNIISFAQDFKAKKPKIVDKFNPTASAAKFEAESKLIYLLNNGQENSNGILNKNGHVEAWLHDFVFSEIPGSPVYRIKLVIERTDENGSASLPIF